MGRVLSPLLLPSLRPESAGSRAQPLGRGPAIPLSILNPNSSLPPTWQLDRVVVQVSLSEHMGKQPWVCASSLPASPFSPPLPLPSSPFSSPFSLLYPRFSLLLLALAAISA